MQGDRADLFYLPPSVLLTPLLQGGGPEEEADVQQGGVPK